MNIPDEYKTGNPGMDAKIVKALVNSVKDRYLRFPNGSTIQIEEPKTNKYSNTKTVVDGITFHSKKEASRYSELKLLEKAKEINELQLQPKFLLLEGFRRNGKKYQDTYYIADFSYRIATQAQPIVEDVKGMRNDYYKLKLKFFFSKYPLIDFREI